MVETPQEFGEEIRRERELREVSLKQLAAVTKVSVRHLEALESGRFDQLPAPVFSRGFLRACAAHLGLDGDRLASAFTHTYEVWAEQNRKREETGVHPSAQWRLSRPRRAVSTSTTVLGLGVAIALAVVTGTAALLKSKVNERPAGSPAAPKTVRGEPGAASLSLPESVAAATFALSPGTGGPLTSTADRGTEPSSRITTAREGTSGVKTLTLKFRDDCWTEVSADGKVVAAELFHGGASQEFKAEHRFSLTLGNAGAVDATLDGRPVKAMGADKQVVRNFVIDDGSGRGSREGPPPPGPTRPPRVSAERASPATAPAPGSRPRPSTERTERTSTESPSTEIRFSAERTPAPRPASARTPPPRTPRPTREPETTSDER